MFENQFRPPQGCNPVDDYLFAKDIEEYINDEIKDSMYYKELAEKAPNKRSEMLLMEFSKDEQQHAKNFMKAYQMLTGKMYTPDNIRPPMVPEYKEALKQRIIAETSDYKKYGEDYLKACRPYLKDLFFMTRTVEAQHAMRIPILLAD